MMMTRGKQWQTKQTKLNSSGGAKQTGALLHYWSQLLVCSVIAVWFQCLAVIGGVQVLSVVDTVVDIVVVVVVVVVWHSSCSLQLVCWPTKPVSE